MLTIEITAFFAPSVLGLKLTENVELPPAAIDALGVVATMKSTALVPEIVMAPMDKEEVPVF